MKAELTDALKDCFAQLAPESTVYLGFSGGVDSTVLLHACRHLHPNIITMHINHGVNAKSDQWQNFCEKFAKIHQIPLKIHQLALSPTANFEAIAREKRYQIFAQYLTKNDIFITAQHRDDQAETVLLRLLRGSGPVGLSAMHPTRVLGEGRLIRPWLAYPKSMILAYAKHHQLNWIEDDSNQNTEFDRNFLRQIVLPLLETRWQNSSKTIARSANLCRLSIPPIISSTKFPIKKLTNLSEESAGTAVYHWLRGVADLLPTERQIRKIVTEIAFAKIDATPQLTWGCGQIRRYQGVLFYLKTPMSLDKITKEYWLDKQLYLPESELTLINQTDKKLRIKFPQGGESIKMQGYKTHKKLKKIFQERSVLPWLRPRIPLVFMDNELVQVINIGFSKEVVLCEQ